MENNEVRITVVGAVLIAAAIIAAILLFRYPIMMCSETLSIQFATVSTSNGAVCTRSVTVG
jgi:hypothetical protein